MGNLSHLFRFLANFTHLLYISHNANFPLFFIPPHFPHFATIFPFSPLSFTSAASWLIQLPLMPMPDGIWRFSFGRSIFFL